MNLMLSLATATVTFFQKKYGLLPKQLPPPHHQPIPCLVPAENKQQQNKQILCPIGADLWSSSQCDNKTSTWAKASRQEQTAKSKGTEQQNHYFQRSSGFRLTEVMCRHEDICISKLKFYQKMGTTHWNQLHRFIPSWHLHSHRFLPVLEHRVSEALQLFKQKTAYVRTTLKKKTFTFPKSSTQAFILYNSISSQKQARKLCYEPHGLREKKPNNQEVLFHGRTKRQH